jgi:membrane protease YdiL (CAAX protease family)
VFPVLFAGAVFLAAVRTIHRKPVWVVFTDGRSFGLGLGACSAAIWTVLWFIGAVYLYGLASIVRRINEYPPLLWIIFFGPCLCIISGQSSVEELFNRGYIQNRVLAWVRRPWIAVVISAVFFALLHPDTNLAAKVKLGSIGIALGMGLLRAGTVSPLIGVHTMDNTLGSLSTLEQPNSSRTWQEAAIAVLELAVWYCWLHWATRDKRKPLEDRRIRL